MMNLFSIYASAFLISAIAIVFYVFEYVLKSRYSNIAWNAGILSAGVLLFYLFASKPEYAVAFALVLVLSMLQVHFYGLRTRRFIPSLIILEAVLAGLIIFGLIPLQYCLVALAFGILGPFLYRTIWQHRIGSKKIYSSIEISRDLVQIAVGALLIIILLSVKFEYAIAIILILVMTSYSINGTLSTLKGSNMLRIFSKIEKPGVIYGQGALFISMGLILFLGAFKSVNLSIFFIITLYFADAIATIVGLSIRWPRLPYNKKKSVAGTLGFFACASLGYFFIGPYAFAFAALLAVLESLPLGNRLDDNIILSIAFILLSYIFIAG